MTAEQKSNIYNDDSMKHSKQAKTPLANTHAVIAIIPDGRGRVGGQAWVHNTLRVEHYNKKGVKPLSGPCLFLSFGEPTERHFFCFDF